jgi:hypothetical protein
MTTPVFAPVAPTLPVVPEETSVTPRSANVDDLLVSVKPDAVKSLTTSTLDWIIGWPVAVFTNEETCPLLFEDVIPALLSS